MPWRVPEYIANWVLKRSRLPWSQKIRHSRGKGIKRQYSEQMWKSLLGRDDDDEEAQDENWFLDESEAICSLSPTQRLYGFAACLIAGLVCMYVSLIVFIIPIKFALLFTFGNMLAIGIFLIGPGQQIRMMLDPVRVYATAIYVGFVVLALICALAIHSKVLTLIAIICEICALIWYSLSYIPFARRIVSDLMIRLFDTEI